MSKKKDQDEGGKLLNKPSTDPGIDRGFELMIRDKKGGYNQRLFNGDLVICSPSLIESGALLLILVSI